MELLARRPIDHQAPQAFPRLEIVWLKLEHESVFVTRQSVIAARARRFRLSEQIGNILTTEAVYRQRPVLSAFSRRRFRHGRWRTLLVIDGSGRSAVGVARSCVIAGRLSGFRLRLRQLS